MDNSILIRVGADISAFSNGMRSATADLDRFQNANKETFDSFKKVGTAFTAGGIAIAAGLGASVKVASDFQSAFAGVRKTTEASEAEFAVLEKGIRNMAKELPASAVDIAAVAEAAGQLGIKKENILAFSRTMIDLGEATNLTADEAAVSFARFANIVGMPQENFDRLGSSIVALGNNMATTEAEITAMSMRLAGVGKQVGLSEADITGLAATMSSLGIEAEAGGTAMSTVMKKIDKSVSMSKEAMQGYADAAGMTTDDFAALWKAKPIEALDGFIKGLGKSAAEGENLTYILDELGIKGIRESDTILRMVGAQDLLSEAVGISTQAWEENSALSEEAAQRYETFESKAEMLKNKFKDFAITVGNVLLPVITDTVDKIGGLVDWFSNLNPKIIEASVIFAAVAAALALVVGPILMLIGFIPAFIAGFSAITGVVTTSIAAISGLAVGVGPLAAVLTVLSGPVGLIIAGIAALTVGTIALVNHLSKDAIPEVDRFGKGVSDATQEALGGFFELSDGISQTMSSISITSSKITEDMKNDIVGKYADMSTQILAGKEKQHTEEVAQMERMFLNSSVLTDEEKENILTKKQSQYDTEVEILEAKEKSVNTILQLAADENRKLTEREKDVINNINKQAQVQAVKVLSASEMEQKIILEKMADSAETLSAQQAAAVIKNSAEARNKTVAEAEAQYDETYAAIVRMRDEAKEITEEQASEMIAEAKRSRDGTVQHAENMHKEVIAGAEKHSEGISRLVDKETGETLSKWQVFKTDFVDVHKEIWKKTKEEWTKITDKISEAWSTMWAASKEFGAKLATTVLEKMAEVKKNITDKWEEAEKFFKDIDLKEIGKDIVAGLIKGISGKFTDVKTKISELANLIPDWAKKILNIQSPSRVMASVGKNIGEGLVEGMGSEVSAISKMAKKVAEAAIITPLQSSFDMASANSPQIAGYQTPRSGTGGSRAITSTREVNSASGNGGFNPQITNHFTPAESTPSEAARQQKRMLQALAVGYR